MVLGTLPMEQKDDKDAEYPHPYCIDALPSLENLLKCSLSTTFTTLCIFFEHNVLGSNSSLHDISTIKHEHLYELGNNISVALLYFPCLKTPIQVLLLFMKVTVMSTSVHWLHLIILYCLSPIYASSPLKTISSNTVFEK